MPLLISLTRCLVLAAGILCSAPWDTRSKVLDGTSCGSFFPIRFGDYEFDPLRQEPSRVDEVLKESEELRKKEQELRQLWGMTDEEESKNMSSEGDLPD